MSIYIVGKKPIQEEGLHCKERPPANLSVQIQPITPVLAPSLRWETTRAPESSHWPHRLRVILQGEVKKRIKLEMC